MPPAYSQGSNNSPLLENGTMRYFLTLSLTLLLANGFTAAEPNQVQLELSDEGLPLQELRPLDRRVYILTLDGKWNRPAKVDVPYYINFLFPDGCSYSHKVTDGALFRRGDVHCVIQQYQLSRHGVSRGGKFRIVVSAGQPVTSAGDAEVISNELAFSWPMNRQISRFLPRSKYSEPEDVDRFPIPGEPEPRPVPLKKPKQLPAPESKPKAPDKTETF
jgi:hypothetical protein